MSSSHVVVTDASLVGSGTPQDPLAVNVDELDGAVGVVTDGVTTTGTGTASDPIVAPFQDFGYLAMLRTLDALAVAPLFQTIVDAGTLRIATTQVFAVGDVLNDLSPVGRKTWALTAGVLDDDLADPTVFAPFYLSWDEVGDPSVDMEVTGLSLAGFPQGQAVFFNNSIGQTKSNILGATTLPSVWFRMHDARSIEANQLDSASDTDIELLPGYGIRFIFDGAVWKPAVDELAVVGP